MLKLTIGLALVTLVACSQCPNNEVCGAGQSCCQNLTGDFSCCPFHHGECCEDHLHCCPEGMLCSVVDLTCINSTNILPLVERIPAKQPDLPKSFRMIPSIPSSEDDIACPDGSFCPAEFSCLLMSSSYGCCPVAQGLVCSDGKHCCPKDHECSADSSSCVKQQKVETVLCGDGTSECPTDTTCCESEDGQCACCPMPKAVCCKDKLHCCPEDSVCDVESSKCLSSTNQELPMWAKFPARIRAEWEDHKQMSTEPELTTTIQITTADNQMTTLSVALPKDVPCNDTAACPDGTTCCKTKDGGWACCSFPKAVCCEDMLHCCPHGTTCDLAAGQCDKPSGPVPWMEKMPVHPIRSQNVAVTQVSSNVPCNDTAACPDGTTCCKTKDGGWACCPFPQAVCCEDMLHCCPHGTTCDLAAGQCDKPSGPVPWMEKMPVQLIRSQNVAVKQVSSNVPCNDTAACPDGTTCCKTKDGGWACCPFPQAVCCEDMLHCCPHGTTCDLAAGHCDESSGPVPWMEKMPVQQIRSQNVAVTQVSSKSTNVPCNDTAACPDGTTCCKTKDGGWACCPFPQAVCCEDMLHCCPHGTACDLAAGQCDKPSGPVPWMEKIPVQPIRSQNVAVTQVSSKSTNVPCNDTAACPDGTTCCKTKDGGWACCPFPQAVCCEDMLHCCPHGTTCDLAAGQCDKPSGPVPWMEKMPVQSIRSQNVAVTQVSSNVPCNDTAACPDGTTCCKTKDGGWACCPFPQAVCCEDMLHCCPHGTTCDLAAGQCDKPSGPVPWMEKMPVQQIRSQNVAVTQVSSNVPCNDTAACPDGTTCCKTKDGGWACCPFPQAVCCQDMLHCCPHGTTCDLAAGQCDKPSGPVPWMEKMPVQPIRSQNVAVTQVSSKSTNVPCNDTAACPDGTTCCKTKDGGWACCPFPQAVCCEDMLHCCPHGTTCDLAAGQCDKPSGPVPWMEKMPTRPRAGQRSSGNVTCDSSHVCPESNTCCKNMDGDLGCCPMPEAVCCTDHFHCCPHATTCDLVTLTCKSSTTSVSMTDLNTPLAKEEQRKYKEVKESSGKFKNRIQCDAHTSCPDYTTCCLITKTHKWGCCPLPNAVCCSDGEHCCPAQYKCDVSGLSCIRGDVVIPWYNKLSAESTSAPQDLGAVKCDEKSSCSADSTCCRLSTGEWGCCPFPEAVCCADQKHCCPEGYRCDLQRSSCIMTTRVYVEITKLTHIQAQKPKSGVSVKKMQCGGGYSCNDDETCCPTSQNTWGCCPSPKAECCDDMQHCCPTGYKCGTGGTCNPARDFDWSRWINWRMFFTKKKRATAL